MHYTITEIAAITNAALTSGAPVEITECSIDSRAILRAGGTLFFALKGERHDGHDYIPALHAAGVRAFVVSERRPEFDALAGANFIHAADVLRALQDLAAHHRHHSRAEVVGVTGSAGKTIVKEWIYQLAPLEWRLYRGPRSYNSRVGVPLSLLGIEENDAIAVIEAGISRRGEMERLREMIDPEIGIFTHLGDAHGENFASRQEKLDEKALLFRRCKLIIGQEGEPLDRVRRACPGAAYLTWGESPGAAVRVLDQRVDGAGRTIGAEYRGERFRFTIPFTDEASGENAMHVACFLLSRGLPPREIDERTRRLVPVAMRMEIKEGINDCTLVNDFYSSDPASFRHSLQALATREPGKERVVILSDFEESGRPAADLYREAGEAIREAGVTRFIGIGENIGRFREAFPPGARFHESTGHFLRHEEREGFRGQLILLKGARRFCFEYIAGFLQKQSHGTLLEVDTDAMVDNLNHFRSLTPARLAVMVKAFSYGSGTREIAALLQYHRVDYLMVAFADEGIELRAAGVTLPIAVMNPEREAFDNMIAFNLEPEIYALELLDEFEQALARHGVKRFPAHVKLNTGMNRSGLDEGEIPALVDFFGAPRALFARSLFSHLVGSDDPAHDDFTRLQASRFERMTAAVQARLDYPVWRHLLNSAGIERFPEYHYDMVRLGIGLHGISAAGAPLKLVSTFKTRVAAIRRLPAGEPVGYSRASVTTRASSIATLPVGYADGLNRHLGNRVGEVVVRGQRVPFIGNICMDSCMIDVTGTGAAVGDEVEIFGKQIPVTEMAERLGTIPYEVLTGVSQRVKRVYFKE
jgi:alanine racemase